MDILELERQIQTLRSRPLRVVCRASNGKECCMSLRECLETGSAFLHVAADELDELLEKELCGL